MSILEKARELGEEIATSVELEEMKKAEMAMINDPEANSLVNEFNQKQRRFMDLKAGGVKLSPEEISEVEDLEKRVLDNLLIVDFFRKQQEFEKIIEQINEIIAEAITGQSPGCPDDCCTSCSGCQV